MTRTQADGKPERQSSREVLHKSLENCFERKEVKGSEPSDSVQGLRFCGKPQETTVLARGTAYKSLEQPVPEQESYLETLCSHGHCRQGWKEDTEQLQCWGRSGEEEKKEGRGERGRDRSNMVVWTRAGLEEGATRCLTGRLGFWCLSKRRRLKGKERPLIAPGRTMIDTIQGDDKIYIKMSTSRSCSLSPSWDRFPRGG